MNNPPIQPYSELQRLSDEFKLICDKRQLQRDLISNRALQEGVRFMLLLQPVMSAEAREIFYSAELYWHWSTDLGGVLHIFVADPAKALWYLDEFLTAVFNVTRVTSVAIGDGKNLLRYVCEERSWNQQ